MATSYNRAAPRLRYRPAEPHGNGNGAAPRRRHVTQGGVVVRTVMPRPSHGGHGERIDLTVMIQSRPRGTVTVRDYRSHPGPGG